MFPYSINYVFNIPIPQQSKIIKIPETHKIYKLFFEAEIKPSFIGSRLLFKEEEKLELLDEYQVNDSTIQIFNHPNKPQNIYVVSPPEYTLPPDKYFILSKAREVVASYKPGKVSLGTVARTRKYFERVYQSTIRDIARQNNISIKRDEIMACSTWKVSEGKHLPHKILSGPYPPQDMIIMVNIVQHSVSKPLITIIIGKPRLPLQRYFPEYTFRWFHG